MIFSRFSGYGLAGWRPAVIFIIMQSLRAKKWIRIALVLLSLATAGFLTAYFLWNKPHREVAAAASLKIQAADLYRIFTADTAAARAQYLQKVLAVEGQLQRVSENQQKQLVATLATGTEGAYINCTFEGPAKGLQPGSTVTIKGICGGLGQGDPDLGIPGDLYLLRCYIAE
jgi:hypothetical protein